MEKEPKYVPSTEEAKKTEDVLSSEAIKRAEEVAREIENSNLLPAKGTIQTREEVNKLYQDIFPFKPQHDVHVKGGDNRFRGIVWPTIGIDLDKKIWARMVAEDIKPAVLGGDRSRINEIENEERSKCYGEENAKEARDKMGYRAAGQ